MPLPTAALWLLLLHAGATWFMTGLIWFVQVVHYPLAALVGAGEFRAYQAAHMARTGLVVGPPMLIELGTTALLVFARPEGVPEWAPWAGAGLLAVVWVSTALFSVPAHGALVEGYDAERIHTLVMTNFIRTIGWTLRAALAAQMIVWAFEARSAA